MNLDKEFLKDVLSVPSVSEREECMRDYISDFAEKRGIVHRQDAKGNLYLIKGALEKGMFCPCMIEHMDTVQSWQTEYVDRKERILVREKKLKSGKTKLYAVHKGASGEHMSGIGADDKAGCAIALALLDTLEHCKAVFCVEEEVGLKGSKELDYGFFSSLPIRRTRTSAM